MKLISGIIQRNENTDEYYLTIDDGEMYMVYPGAISKAREFWITQERVNASLQPYTIITDDGGSTTRYINTFVAIGITAAK